jgi:hypothetical protein
MGEPTLGTGLEAAIERLTTQVALTIEELNGWQARAVMLQRQLDAGKADPVDPDPDSFRALCASWLELASSIGTSTDRVAEFARLRARTQRALEGK